MKKQSLNALAASYRADLLYYIERAKLGKCPPHWQAYCFGEIAAASGHHRRAARLGLIGKNTAWIRQ